MIAMAISASPDLLIADEPSTALDVTIQAQVLALLKSLQTQMNLTVLLITHNFAVVSEVCDTVSVMYAGQIVETAPVQELFTAAAHPYSQALIACIPKPGTAASFKDGRPAAASSGGKLPVIPGFPPRLLTPPAACLFAPRCSRKTAQCCTMPPLRNIHDDHSVLCGHL